MIAQTEPLLAPNPNRFTSKPIQYPDLWEAFKTAQDLLWTAEEVPLHQDLDDWNKLNEDEQRFIKYTLAFFAASDGIVMENLASRFSNEVQIVEARHFYALQMFIEAVHSEVYSDLIDTYVKDSDEKLFLFNAIETIPCVKEKANWAMRWIESDTSFAERLIAFAVVEGIFFSSSFCSIYWLKKRGLMVNGLGLSNEYIARDESMHCDFACLLYSHMVTKVPVETIHQIVDEAVQIETEFVTNALPVRLIGMNSDSMVEYVKFCANRLLRQLNAPTLYNTNNPFDFAEKIGSSVKVNFFEGRNSQYQRHNGRSASETSGGVMVLSDDF